MIVKFLQILTSGMISGDQLAVKRIFALLSQPLEDFKDLYYPSFAEWVSCKVDLFVHLDLSFLYALLFSFVNINFQFSFY